MEGLACMQCNRTKLYLAHPSGPFQSVTDRQVSSKTALRAYALMLFTVSVGGGLSAVVRCLKKNVGGAIVGR